MQRALGFPLEKLIPGIEVNTDLDWNLIFKCSAFNKNIFIKVICVRNWKLESIWFFFLIFNEKNKLPGMGSIRCSSQKLIYSGKNIHIKTEMEY